MPSNPSEIPTQAMTGTPQRLQRAPARRSEPETGAATKAKREGPAELRLATQPTKGASAVAERHVAILLCTFDGAEFLAQQLDSILSQTHANWSIYASDDGSSDTTLEILERYRSRLGRERLVILKGPGQGFAANFMSLVQNHDIVADCYAFCDQDDLWFPDKLTRGLTRLAAAPAGQPALFCSRTRLIDAGGSVIGYSPMFGKTPCFRNALVQSIAGANTMMLNAPARSLLGKTPDDVHIVSHDWLSYMLVSGCGGRVWYDPLPTIDYRQHQGNVIGSNTRVLQRLERVRKIFAGTWREWNQHNIAALSFCRDSLTEDNRRTLDCFCQARSAGPVRSIYLLRRAGVYRQSLTDDVGLMVAASLGRI